ncbi:unnamed protein product [Phytomonas sp. Hart1]|nr:unnamed protein product [Phytomonas sp. Hart1]|eukprot:CCW68603.1 unnamed protein product [Phytomonas sp. isolate Hart1]
MPINSQRPPRVLTNNRVQRLHPWDVYAHSVAVLKGRKPTRRVKSPCPRNAPKSIACEYYIRNPKDLSAQNGERQLSHPGESYSEGDSVGDNVDISHPSGCIPTSKEGRGGGGIQRRPRRYEEMIAYKGADGAPKPSLAAVCRDIELNTLAILRASPPDNAEDGNDDNDKEAFDFLGYMPKDERELCHATAAFLSRLPEADAQRVLVSIAQEAETTRMVKLYNGVVPRELEDELSNDEKDSTSALLARLRAQWQQHQKRSSSQSREKKRQTWVQQNRPPQPSSGRSEVKLKGRAAFLENPRASSSNSTRYNSRNSATKNPSPSVPKQRPWSHDNLYPSGAPTTATSLRTPSSIPRPREYVSRSAGSRAKFHKVPAKSNDSTSGRSTRVEDFPKKNDPLEENQNNLLPTAAVDMQHRPNSFSEFSSVSSISLLERPSSISKMSRGKRSCSILSADVSSSFLNSTSIPLEKPPLAPPLRTTSGRSFKKVVIERETEPSTLHQLPQQVRGELDGVSDLPDSGRKNWSPGPSSIALFMPVSSTNEQHNLEKVVMMPMSDSRPNSTDSTLSASTDDISCVITNNTKQAPILNSTPAPPRASEPLSKQELETPHTSDQANDAFCFYDDKLPWED